MFDSLSGKLDKAFQVLKGHGKITEINVAETLKEVRRALLDADVNFKIAKEFTNRVKEKALGQEVLKTLNPGQLLVKIVKDELTQLMGGEVAGVNLASKPSVILMSGLQGSGKTTFSGKLALHLKNKKAKNPLLVACDVYRPAAIDQLTIVAEQVGAGIYKDLDEKDPVKIALAGIAYAKANKYDLVLTERRKASILNTTASTRVVIRYVSASKRTPLSCSIKISTAGICELNKIPKTKRPYKVYPSCFNKREEDFCFKKESQCCCPK